MRLRILADLYAHDEALFAYAEHAIRAVGMPLGARGLRLTLTLEQVADARSTPGIRPEWFTALRVVADDEIRKAWTRREVARADRIQHDGLDGNLVGILCGMLATERRWDAILLEGRAAAWGDRTPSTVLDHELEVLTTLAYVVPAGTRTRYNVHSGYGDVIGSEWRTPVTLTPAGASRAENHLEHEVLPDGEARTALDNAASDPHPVLTMSTEHREH